MLELALREALQLRHDYIGTKHLLLGVIREADGAGAWVLTALGVTLDQVRHQVAELLSDTETPRHGDTPCAPGPMRGFLSDSA